MKTPFDNKCCKCEGCHNCDCNNTGTFEFYMEPALYNFAKKMTHEMDSCPPEELCQPCWDNCRCMDEILIDRKKIEHLTENVTELNDRTVKVEKRVKDISDNVSQWMGELARKEQEDIDCINTRIDDEIERATNREDQIDAKLDQEIADRIADVDAEEARAIGEEQRIDSKLNQEIADRIDDVDAEENRAKGVEQTLTRDLADEAERSLTNAVYNPQDKKIYFYNKDNVVKAYVNTDDFVVDGMVRNVEIINGALEIQWNTDGTDATGHAYTRIPLTDIFNPNNYYTSAWIDEHITLHRIEPLEAKVNQGTLDYNTVLQYGQAVTIAKVNDVNITATLPSYPSSVTAAAEDGLGNNIYNTYVSNITTNGNNVVWTKAGQNNSLTVPYATKANQDNNGDVIHTTYLKSADASNTYLTQTNAASTYLTQANAASTYLTQANASSTYLTQTNAASTYSTKGNTIRNITLDGNYLKLWFDDGSTSTCSLPTAITDVNVLSNAVSNLINRVTALESMWEANSTTHTLSPKSPYTNVSMSGNLSVGGTASVTGNTSLSNVSASGTASVTGATTLSGNLSVGGTASVTGNTTLSNVSASGTLSVGSTATITGNTTVSGSVTGAGFYDSLIS